jgi:hypothetical protein
MAADTAFIVLVAAIILPNATGLPTRQSVALGSMMAATTATNKCICPHRQLEYHHTCTLSSELQLL